MKKFSLVLNHLVAEGCTTRDILGMCYVLSVGYLTLGVCVNHTLEMMVLVVAP